MSKKNIEHFMIYVFREEYNILNKYLAFTLM